jgi:hypothetical protein
VLRFWALEAFGSGAVYSPNQKAVTSWVKKFQPNKQLGHWHYGIMLDSIQLISIVTTCYRSRFVFCFPTKSVSVDLWTIVIINLNKLSLPWKSNGMSLHASTSEKRT